MLDTPSRPRRPERWQADGFPPQPQDRGPGIDAVHRRRFPSGQHSHVCAVTDTALHLADRIPDTPEEPPNSPQVQLALFALHRAKQRIDEAFHVFLRRPCA